MVRYYKFFDPIFRTQIRVFVGEAEECRAYCIKRLKISGEQAEFVLDKEDGTFPDGCAGTAFPLLYNDNTSRLQKQCVWLRHFTGDVKTTGILTHETLHLTKQSMDHVGVEFSDQSEEVYAYWQEWAFETILDKLLSELPKYKKKKQKAKKKDDEGAK